MQQMVSWRRHPGFLGLLLLTLLWRPATGLDTPRQGSVVATKLDNVPQGGTTAKQDASNFTGIQPLKVSFGVPYRKITFINQCQSPIIYAIRFAPIFLNYYVVLGYFTLQPGASAYVADTQATGFYFSAITTDLLYSWDGTGEPDAVSVCVPGATSCIDTELMTWQPLDPSVDLPVSLVCSSANLQSVRATSSSILPKSNPKARSSTRKLPQSAPLPLNGLHTSALAGSLSYKVVAFKNVNCASPVYISVRFQPILASYWVNAEDFWLVGLGKTAIVTYTQGSSFLFWAQTMNKRVSWSGTSATCIPSSLSSTCTTVSMRSYSLPARWNDMAINLVCPR